MPKLADAVPDFIDAVTIYAHTDKAGRDGATNSPPSSAIATSRSSSRGSIAMGDKVILTSMTLCAPRYPCGARAARPRAPNEASQRHEPSRCPSHFSPLARREYDCHADAMLAVCAAEKLPGDPPWLLIISGPGNAKTETVQATNGLGAQIVSTITSEGALLSATPEKRAHQNATGGCFAGSASAAFLYQGCHLDPQHEPRHASAVLAALREIHDGLWHRNVGSDGGQTLTWKGRIVVIGACTTAWDQAHAVVATMGDRFILIRSDSHPVASKRGARPSATPETKRKCARRWRRRSPP